MSRAHDGRIEGLLETMARRGAAYGCATRRLLARYWPQATRDAGGATRLAVTSEAIPREALPEPITALDTDTRAALDERIMEEACAAAHAHGIAKVEVELRATGGPALRTEDVRGHGAKTQSIDLHALGLSARASTRCVQRVGGGAPEHLLVAWPIGTALAELARSACEARAQAVHPPPTHWNATIHIEEDGRHEIEIAPYRLEPVPGGRAKGRYGALTLQAATAQ